jgi:ATP-dependent DNA ligase
MREHKRRNAAIAGREIDQFPFVNLPEKKDAYPMDREKMKSVHWLKPKMVCEVAFNERTNQGHLRRSKFLRLRDRSDARTHSTLMSAASHAR